MYTNLTNGKRNKAAQIAMSAMALSMLTSCHFGDVEDVRPKDYADEERQFSITLDATTPSGDVSRATRTNITDLFTDGLKVVWKAGDQIAMFGQQIRDEKAVPLTAEEDGSNPHWFNQNSHNAYPAEDDEDFISWANFTGDAKLQVGNTKIVNGNPVWDETNGNNSSYFSFVYPYARFANESATASFVTLDFTEQSGKLAPTPGTDKSKTIATDYEYAWGYGKGFATGHVSFGSLTFVDAMGDKCNDSEAHLKHVYKDGGLVLDNKMSIVRFALVYQPDEKSEELVMFKDYIANAGCRITKITLRDNHNHLYPTASLNLESGEVYGVTAGNIEIDDYQGVSLENILPDDKENRGSKESWGSAFYLAIPVPEKDMRMDCTLEIHVDGNNDAVAGLYYANFEERTFNEGRYYMTAPITCTKKEQASLDNEIRIYLYYKASLVYDINDIEGGTDAGKDPDDNTDNGGGSDGGNTDGGNTGGDNTGGDNTGGDNPGSDSGTEIILAVATGENSAVGNKNMFTTAGAEVGDKLRIYFNRVGGYNYNSYNVQIANRFWNSLIFAELGNRNVIDNQSEAGRQAADQGYFEFTLTQERLNLLMKTDPYNDPQVGMYIQRSYVTDVKVTLIKK